VSGELSNQTSPFLLMQHGAVVEEFSAEPVEDRASIIDGTCFAMTGALFDRVGVSETVIGRRP